MFTSDVPPTITPRTTMTLVFLCLSTFANVTFEIFPVGLISNIAHDLHSNTSAIGYMVSGYAILAAFLTTPSIIFSRRACPRKLFLFSLLVLVVSEVFSQLSHTYTQMLLSRSLAATTHGMLWSLAAPIAVQLVPKSRSGTATAYVFGGVTLAVTVGSPLTTLLGQHFGWRLSELVLTVVTFFVTTVLWKLLPRNSHFHSTTPEKAAQFPHHSAVWKYIFALCGFVIIQVVAHFVTFTYIAVIIRSLFQGPTFIVPFLTIFGFAGIFSTLFFGRTHNTHPVMSTMVTLGTFAAGLAGLALTMVIGNTVAGVIVILLSAFLWGFGYATLGPTHQFSVMLRAGSHVATASSLYVTAYQIGIAGGSALGAILVHAGTHFLVGFSVCLSCCGVIMAALSTRLFRH